MYMYVYQCTWYQCFLDTRGIAGNMNERNLEQLTISHGRELKSGELLSILLICFNFSIFPLHRFYSIKRLTYVPPPLFSHSLPLCLSPIVMIYFQLLQHIFRQLYNTTTRNHQAPYLLLWYKGARSGPVYTNR